MAQPGRRASPAGAQLETLAAAAREREEAEERRLFYVAATRARERLILSGAARYEAWERSSGPITWLGRAFVREAAALLRDGGGVSEAGVRVTAVLPDTEAEPAAPAPDGGRASGAGHRCGPSAAAALDAAPPEPVPPEPALAPPEPAATPPALSYTALTQLRRCGYRFYVERVLGLPPTGS